jgi:hypothetical protein
VRVVSQEAVQLRVVSQEAVQLRVVSQEAVQLRVVSAYQTLAAVLKKFSLNKLACSCSWTGQCIDQCQHPLRWLYLAPIRQLLQHTTKYPAWTGRYLSGICCSRSDLALLGLKELLGVADIHS